MAAGLLSFICRVGVVLADARAVARLVNSDGCLRMLVRTRVILAVDMFAVGVTHVSSGSPLPKTNGLRLVPPLGNACA